MRDMLVNFEREKKIVEKITSKTTTPYCFCKLCVDEDDNNDDDDSDGRRD